MEDEEKNIIYEKNLYKYKTLYLIRRNIPSAEYIYIIIFFLKYAGLILFSTSLNNKQENEPRDNLDNSSYINIFAVFQKFLITSSSLKILRTNYTEFCI